MDRLGAALPIPARVVPELQMTLRERRGGAIPASCRVTWINYAGDEGRIVSQLETGAETEEAVFTPITHLRFDPRPLAPLPRHRAVAWGSEFSTNSLRNGYDTSPRDLSR
jgi:hypothetical protein